MGEQSKLLASLRRKYARPANLGKPLARGTTSGSWLGDVRLALPHEKWPMGPSGPMEPIAQINLEELPARPTALADLSMITVFLSWNDEGFDLPVENPFPINGSKWLLRAYREMDALVPVECPVERRVGCTAIRWVLLESDFASWASLEVDDCAKIDDAGVKWYDHFGTSDGLKIGGWPYLLQSAHCWAPSNMHPSKPAFQFQIDSNNDLGMYFADGGVCYFGRGIPGHEHEWAFECQFL